MCQGTTPPDLCTNFINKHCSVVFKIAEALEEGSKDHQLRIQVLEINEGNMISKRT